MNPTGLKEQQQRKIKTQAGFLAALDQSGGSTPKALASYGIKEGAWSNDEQMFALVHQMRARIITSPSFNGDRILAAILFEGTMEREIEGQPTADYLWNVKRVVPFLKVDKGLTDEKDGVHLMKPMPGLAALLAKANTKRIFGTKRCSPLTTRPMPPVSKPLSISSSRSLRRSLPRVSCRLSSLKWISIARRKP